MIAVEVVNGTVVRSIVGTVEWATENLGGFWVHSETPVWLNGSWDEVNGFRPPSPYPSWIWLDDQWQPPVPYPEYPAIWNEDTKTWVELENSNDPL